MSNCRPVGVSRVSDLGRRLRRFIGSSAVKKQPVSGKEMVGLIPELERCPGEGNSKPTPVFLPGKYHEGQCATVPWVTKSQTLLRE